MADLAAALKDYGINAEAPGGYLAKAASREQAKSKK